MSKYVPAILIYGENSLRKCVSNYIKDLDFKGIDYWYI